MSVTYNKPAGLKYTDLCIYIDENMSKIKEKGKYPMVEAKIYEYLYHIIYALACKGAFFKKFEEYDSFALYGAAELYISMRNKLIHSGEQIRGKEIVPVKSCLNFIKSVLFPLKVNYQRQTFATVMDPAIHGDLSKISEDMTESIQSCYRRAVMDDYNAAIKDVKKAIRDFIDNTPFKYDELMKSKLYISVLLSLLDEITIPNKLRDRLKAKEAAGTQTNIADRLSNVYKNNESQAILWHLDERYSTYVKFFVKKAKMAFTDSFSEYRHENDLSDTLIDDIMHSAYNIDERDEYLD